MMRTIGKTIVGILFVFFLSISTILFMLRFELLNSDFLFKSFERHNIYQRLPQVLVDSIPNDPNLGDEEKFGFTQVVKRITPQGFKSITETNLTQVLNFINGDSNDVVISLPAKLIGLGTRDIVLSLSEFQALNPDSRLQVFNGIGRQILILLILMIFVLFSLFLIYGRLTEPKGSLMGKRLILIGGINLLLTGLISRFYFLFLEKSMPTNLEPSQAIIKLFSSTLLADLAFTYMLLGIVLIIVFFIMKLFIKRKLRTE